MLLSLNFEQVGVVIICLGSVSHPLNIYVNHVIFFFSRTLILAPISFLFKVRVLHSFSIKQTFLILAEINPLNEDALSHEDLHPSHVLSLDTPLFLLIAPRFKHPHFINTLRPRFRH